VTARWNFHNPHGAVEKVRAVPGEQLLDALCPLGSNWVAVVICTGTRADRSAFPKGSPPQPCRVHHPSTDGLAPTEALERHTDPRALGKAIRGSVRLRDVQVGTPSRREGRTASGGAGESDLLRCAAVGPIPVSAL
jgi:hypothetical protein